MAEDFIAIDEVKSVLEIDLKNALLFHRNVIIGDESVKGVDYTFAPSPDADCELKRFEKVGGARGN